ncbi:MAG: rhodanese-like domain-containing protein [Candidatus Accumulibacter sp.]|nr:rhodanese-like domain-containing protein [Accumulibacter sp.]
MFKKSIAGLAIVLMLLVTAAVAVDNPKPDTPSSAPGATIIDVDQGKRLLDNRSAAFFDMRNPLNFGKGHLPGATLMAYRERSTFQPDFDATKDKVDLSKLPADKNARIVLYSDGPKGWKSYKASVLAARAGYSKVFWMRDGFAVWVARGLPVEQ